MNQNNYKLELLTENLAMVLEALESYIQNANYYSDWTRKGQFYARTASVYKISLEVAEGGFFSQFSVTFRGSFGKERRFFGAAIDKNLRKEIQKEFYKWIDHSGITAENCPEKLKHYLNEINEALENGDSKLCQDYQTVLKEEKLKLLEKSPFYYQAYKEVDKKLGYVGLGELPISKAKNYELKIKGDVERGQQTFQQIKNSITSQPEFTFPINGENYTRKVEEKIKELEGKKGQEQPIQPKEDWKPGYIIDTFVDILEEDLELYIQKLDYYPNFKAHEWERKEDQEHWEKKSVSEVEGLSRVGLKTMAGILGLLKRDDPNYYPILINQLKSKFLLWQKEKKIEINNCPNQLREILLKFNEVLDSKKPWKKMKDERSNENENKEEELAKIIIEVKFELAGLKKNLGSELNDLENKLKHSKSVSEAQGYQKQIKQKIDQKKKKQQELDATNKNKLSLPVKIVLGAGVGLLFGVIVIVYWVIKNRKIKK